MRSHLVNIRGLILCLLTSLASVPPAAAQAWEGHVSGLRSLGSNPGGGFAFGGGVLAGNRLGFDAEFGYLVGADGAPLLSVGATWRLTRARTVLPFVSGGLLRLGDLAEVYAGGGIRVGLSPRTAFRLELRGAFPAADLRGCVPDCGSPSRAFTLIRVAFAFGPGS